MTPTRRRRIARIAAMVLGGSFILGGCDPTIQSTVENGIITVSNSFLTSLFQAGLQVYQEQQNSNTSG